jgi:hypothetical protein
MSENLTLQDGLRAGDYAWLYISNIHVGELIQILNITLDYNNLLNYDNSSVNLKKYVIYKPVERLVSAEQVCLADHIVSLSVAKDLLKHTVESAELKIKLIEKIQNELDD